MMNPLMLLPPEMAHKAGICAMKMGLGPRAKADDPALQVQLFGKTLSNPVGLAAGAEKQGEALAGWAQMGFGFVEAGTVTVAPRSGNPGPRIWRLTRDHAVVNWMGLPGAGLTAFVDNLEKFSRHPLRQKLVIGASIASPDGDLEEFTQLAAACAPMVDYLTLNASCPNVAHAADGEHAPAQTAAAQVKAAVKGADGIPVLLKLGPTRDEAVLKDMVEAALAAGAAGIVATNTMPFDKRDLLGEGVPANWPQNSDQPVGGYSGPALLDTAVWMVERIRKIVGPDAPLIGVGGVQSGADAVRLIDAGADAVQLYTGLIYKGPGLLDEIKRSVLSR